MSESQSDCFFSMLDHAIAPVRVTKFAEVETGLKLQLIDPNSAARARYMHDKSYNILKIYCEYTNFKTRLDTRSCHHSPGKVDSFDRLIQIMF